MKHLKNTICIKTMMPVLRSGFFASLTGGLITGTLHVLFAFLFNVTLTWLFIIILAHVIAKNIKKSYQTYHIIYRFLSVFFFLLAFYIMHVTLVSGVLFVRNLLSFHMVLWIIDPIKYFSFLWPFHRGFFEVNNILDVVFMTIGVFLSYRYSK